MTKTNTLKQQELRYRVTSESFADKKNKNDRIITYVVVALFAVTLALFVR